MVGFSFVGRGGAGPSGSFGSGSNGGNPQGAEMTRAATLTRPPNSATDQAGEQQDDDDDDDDDDEAAGEAHDGDDAQGGHLSRPPASAKGTACC
ncbi:hypothetical protein JCM8115_003378 [Rhodotorula mucilaginosa]